MNAIREAAGNTIVVAPLHSYVIDKIKEYGLEWEKLKLLPSLSYPDFAYTIKYAKGIITDSGNVSEEASFRGIPCLTLNTYAEHPETCTLGTNRLVGEDIELLYTLTRDMITEKWKHYRQPERWDGRTAERIVHTLLIDNNMI